MPRRAAQSRSPMIRRRQAQQPQSRIRRESTRERRLGGRRVDADCGVEVRLRCTRLRMRGSGTRPRARGFAGGRVAAEMEVGCAGARGARARCVRGDVANPRRCARVYSCRGAKDPLQQTRARARLVLLFSIGFRLIPGPDVVSPSRDPVSTDSSTLDRRLPKRGRHQQVRHSSFRGTHNHPTL